MAYATSFDAETALIQFEHELQEATRAYGVVEQEMNEHRRKMLDMEIKKNDLRELCRKGRENIKRIESELRLAKTHFFRLKAENL